MSIETTQPHSSATASQDVVFYVLNSSEPKEREQFLAKLLKTIWKQQRRADVRFADIQEAQRFDLTLWNQSPQSFIHHAFAQEMKAPIQLFGEQIDKKCEDVLINMHPNFADFYPQYQRTIEILDQSEYLIEMGRERWKAYKKANLEPLVHKIGF
ncbi:DNA polymerase III subunit chi [Thiomicrorhabdus sediminis]|uniref:DNA polymerase III subunit chi n=1 Tax=Thiomicrorhabdus sediminis TaxID=2580412 RepID=A0A4P9K4E0_9GAMM|nr:DNA polymerase III subunit chi [Thiomicrorhabdus sediminis]QCU89581.1 DNA polymerase III subunit chi [Thiomicrorhabdus sediminis]